MANSLVFGFACVFLALATACVAQNNPLSINDVNWENAKTIYEFNAKTIDGDVISLNKYRGKVVVIVNVASNCGLTDKNYKQLNELYDKYESQGLRILAFPSNQFASQEPGTDSEIKAFMQKKGVRFDAFSKIDVNGDNAHPLYKFLKEKKGGILGDFIKWNFTKFLINKEGVPVERYAPTTEPKSMDADIKALL